MYDIGYVEVAVFLLTVLVFYRYTRRDKRRDHLPPHVRGWPIINQTFAHLEDDPTGHVIGWAKKYGEIFCTTSATTTFIWLNSREAFKELIDRRSAIYSSRHPQPLVLDVASAGKRITFMPYGKDWRALRNIFHRLLTPQMSRSYTPTQMFEARQLSVDLLENPQDFYMHNRRYSASVIMQIIYGRRIPQCTSFLLYLLIQGIARRYVKFTVSLRDLRITVDPGHSLSTCFRPWQTLDSLTL
jgi:hypothetical protein